MAKGSFGVPNMEIRGRIGDLVFLPQGNGRTIVRQVPDDLPPRTALQEASSARMSAVAAAWQALSLEDAAAWERYVADARAALSQAGGKVPTRAYNAFQGLSTKRLQMFPDERVPRLPPATPFLGDGIVVTVEVSREDASLPSPTVPPSARASLQGEPSLVFSSAAPNAPGVLTELLLQPLAGRHRRPTANRYRTRAFVAFTAEAPAFSLAVKAGAYACAIRFVREDTGQETAVLEVGKLVVEG